MRPHTWIAAIIGVVVSLGCVLPASTSSGKSAGGVILFYAARGQPGHTIDGISLVSVDNKVRTDFDLEPLAQRHGYWSPDGKQIMILSSNTSGMDIAVMNADGSDVLTLYHIDQFIDEAIWSPDGSRIAFVSRDFVTNKLSVMNADGSGLVTLSESSQEYEALEEYRRLDWSPDGKQIAFVGSLSGVPFSDHIYVVNADGGDPRKVTYSMEGPHSAPVWSPDGTKIAFQSERDHKWDIYIIDVDGSNPVQLTTSAASKHSPVWSPDGTTIAFTTNRDGKSEIYIISLDGSKETNLTNNPAEDIFPAWSPDGSQIAFTSDRDGNYEIYVINIDGSGLTRLTDDPAEDMLPEWQPAPS